MINRILGLIDQIEQQGLSSVDIEKEEALFALDLIQSGKTHIEELFKLQNEATDGIV